MPDQKPDYKPAQLAVARNLLALVAGEQSDAFDDLPPSHHAGADGLPGLVSALRLVLTMIAEHDQNMVSFDVDEYGPHLAPLAEAMSDLARIIGARVVVEFFESWEESEEGWQRGKAAQASMDSIEARAALRRLQDAARERWRGGASWPAGWDALETMTDDR